MIPQSDTLHAIAEIAIAIAGFAGIVAAIDRRSAIPTTGAHNSLTTLLGSSLGVALFAFVPEWIASARLSPELVWQASNGLFGIYRLTYVSMIVLSARRAGRERPFRFPLPIGTLLGIMHLAASAGALPDFHYFLYLTGLLWGIGVSLLSFWRLVRNALAGQSAA